MSEVTSLICNNNQMDLKIKLPFLISPRILKDHPRWQASRINPDEMKNVKKWVRTLLRDSHALPLGFSGLVVLFLEYFQLQRLPI